MLVNVHHQVKQLEQFLKSQISMKYHQTKLFSGLLMKFEDVSVTTVGIRFYHNHVVVIKQSHDEAFVHLNAQLG